MKILKIILLG